MRKFYTTLLVLFVLPFISFTQNTVGVTTYVDSLVSDGYNLLYPNDQPTLFLIDNCGRVVHQWDDSTNIRNANHGYLLENGNVLVGKRDAIVTDDPIWAGGGGEMIEIRDWDNNLIWSFYLNDSTWRLHHDFKYMPNGNVLMVAWENYDSMACVNAGRNTSKIKDGEVWNERIMEVKPIGTDSFEIVWEWRSWDHLVQDFDSTKANYGDPALSPGKIDFNFMGNGLANGPADWLHCNAVAYNAELDQIALSIPKFDEIWIIDHSTTTAEAATGSGGLSGKGGDLIYRWGNPLAYRQGDSSYIHLGFQHDVHWIEMMLDSNAQDYGKLMIYNNRLGTDYSGVTIIDPMFDKVNWEYPMASNMFLPFDPDSVYVADVPQDMYSNIISNAQRLPNGNTLICSGRFGYIREVAPDRQVAWEYVNPYVFGSPVSQGDTVTNGNSVFRMYRYAPDYAGFNGRDLTPGSPLELNPDTTFCQYLVIGREEPELLEAGIYPNPSQGKFFIEMNTSKPLAFSVVNVLGTEVIQSETRGRLTEVNTAGLIPGIYFVKIEGITARKIIIR